MTARIIPFPVSVDRAVEILRARALTVTCPACGATPDRRCTNRDSKVIRLWGPHPDRIAVAEAALDKGSDDA